MLSRATLLDPQVHTLQNHSHVIVGPWRLANALQTCLQGLQQPPNRAAAAPAPHHPCHPFGHGPAAQLPDTGSRQQRILLSPAPPVAIPVIVPTRHPTLVLHRLQSSLRLELFRMLPSLRRHLHTPVFSDNISPEPWLSCPSKKTGCTTTCFRDNRVSLLAKSLP